MPNGIIPVHNPVLDFERLEKGGLGPEVLLHIPVKIQVVPCQVREHRSFHLHTCHPVQRERMGRYLDDTGPATAPNHCVHESKEIRRFGGCPGRADDLCPHKVLDRSDKPGFDPGLPEYPVNKIGAGRFTVCSGDTHDFQREDGSPKKFLEARARVSSDVGGKNISTIDLLFPLPRAPGTYVHHAFSRLR